MDLSGIDATEHGRIGRAIQLNRSKIATLFGRGLPASEIAFDLEIPQRAVQIVIDELTGHPGPGDPTPEEIAERAWQIRSGQVVIVTAHEGDRPAVRQKGRFGNRPTFVTGTRLQQPRGRA